MSRACPGLVPGKGWKTRGPEPLWQTHKLMSKKKTLSVTRHWDSEVICYTLSPWQQLTDTGSKFYHFPTVEENNLIPLGPSGGGDMRDSAALNLISSQLPSKLWTLSYCLALRETWVFCWSPKKTGTKMGHSVVLFQPLYFNGYAYFSNICRLSLQTLQLWQIHLQLFQIFYWLASLSKNRQPTVLTVL